jgi:hypothetical protein
VGLEWGLLSLVSIIEELLEWKSSGSGSKKNEINGRGDPLRWPRDTPFPKKLTLTSPTSGGRSVGIVRLLAKATEFSFNIRGFYGCEDSFVAIRNVGTHLPDFIVL